MIFRDLLADRDYLLINRDSSGRLLCISQCDSIDPPDGLRAALEDVRDPISVFVFQGGVVIIRNNQSISPSRVSLDTPVRVLLTQ